MRLDYALSTPLVPLSQYYSSSGAIAQGVSTPTPVFSIAVPMNSMVFFNARLKISADLFDPPVPVTVNTTNEMFTAAGGHKLTTGMPVNVGGTTLPAGAVGTTTYYAGVLDANTFRLYDTPANASLISTLGLLNLTTAGSGVTVTNKLPVAVDQGIYLIKGVARSRRDGMSVLGPPNIIPFSDIGSLVVGMTKDEPNGLALIIVTPDGTRALRYETVVNAAIEGAAV